MESGGAFERTHRTHSTMKSGGPTCSGLLEAVLKAMKCVVWTEKVPPLGTSEKVPLSGTYRAIPSRKPTSTHGYCLIASGPEDGVQPHTAE